MKKVVYNNNNLNENDINRLEKRIKAIITNDKEALEKYTKILYAEARLIEGLPIDNPTEISNLVCEFISK